MRNSEQEPRKDSDTWEGKGFLDMSLVLYKDSLIPTPSRLHKILFEATVYKGTLMVRGPGSAPIIKRVGTYVQ